MATIQSFSLVPGKKTTRNRQMPGREKTKYTLARDVHVLIYIHRGWADYACQVGDRKGVSTRCGACYWQFVGSGSFWTFH